VRWKNKNKTPDDGLYSHTGSNCAIFL